MLDTLLQPLERVQQALFESLVQPALFHLGLMHLAEDAFVGVTWLLAGVLQLVIIVTLFRALEAWRPVEPVTDRAAIRTDIVYSLIHRLGLFRVAMFFTVDAVATEVLASQLRWLGWQPWQPDQLWPGVTDLPWVSLLIYLVLFDCVDYWLHRGQHGFRRWWQLHALHHSQRQMTRWSDNRNHLLDDVFRDAAFVSVALLLGVGPGQFVAIVALTQLLESLSHANVKLHFGPVLGRVLVSPAYHRLHHAIGVGHESHGPGSLGGHNFAVLFPVWDIVFRTARFDFTWEATGIRDQLPGEGARDYGQGFWRQQWLGLKRFIQPAA
ncbi:MAG: sterol desaturase family protein [Rubrivivax sp.]|jgi:sterol desaturase/sphingolipid hydroxylase (fatty acid hydroxylase superfamily)|nr:sterol desaturase family protein [Rubrivivax sp.]